MIPSYWVSTTYYVPLDIKIYNIDPQFFPINLCAVSVPNDSQYLCLVELWSPDNLREIKWLTPTKIKEFLETNQLVEA